MLSYRRVHLLTFPCALLGLSLTPAPARALPAQTEQTLSLAQLVNLALGDSPLLGAQDAQVEEGRLSAGQARVWGGPTAEVAAGRRREGPDAGPRYELQLAQPLPWTRKPGLRGDILDLETQARRIKRSAAQVELTLAIARGAYEYSASRRKATFADRRRKRFELIESYLAGRVFATPQRKAEARVVGNRVKNLVAESIKSGAAYRSALESLRQIVPLEPGRYPEVDVPWLGGAVAFDTAAVLAAALEKNPGLRVQRLEARSTALEAVFARRDGLPDASVIGIYEQGKAAQLERNYGVGLSLAFPSWNANRSGILASEQRKVAGEKTLAFEERRLRAEVPRALIEYEAARQVVLQYPPATLDAIDDQLRQADQGFRKGQVDLLTFLELDGSAAETYGRVLDAQAELAVKASTLLDLTADPDALKRLGSL